MSEESSSSTPGQVGTPGKIKHYIGCVWLQPGQVKEDGKALLKNIGGKKRMNLLPSL
jgi:hypothetical protein